MTGPTKSLTEITFVFVSAAVSLATALGPVAVVVLGIPWYCCLSLVNALDARNRRDYS